MAFDDRELQQGRSDMLPTGLADAKDPSLRALDCILDAWEEGADAGVAPEFMAYAAIYAALTDLVANYGEEAVAKLTAGLGPRVMRGEFTIYQARQ